MQLSSRTGLALRQRLAVKDADVLLTKQPSSPARPGYPNPHRETTSIRRSAIMTGGQRIITAESAANQ